jgi:hypothetical protein
MLEAYGNCAELKLFAMTISLMTGCKATLPGQSTARYLHMTTRLQKQQSPDSVDYYCYGSGHNQGKA